MNNYWSASTSALLVLVLLGKSSVALAQESTNNVAPGSPRDSERYEISLPKIWAEHKEWAFRGKDQFAEDHIQGCRAFLNSQTNALAQVCVGDDSFFVEDSQEETERQFLAPAPGLVGRSFLTEHLMINFLFPTPEFFGESGRLLAELMSGKIEEKEIMERVVFASDRQLILRTTLKPKNAYDLYVRMLPSGNVISILSNPPQTKTDIDANYEQHRYGSLGTFQSACREWQGFVVVSGAPISEEVAHGAGIPRQFAGKWARYFWLISTDYGNQEVARKEIHVFLAEMWDGKPSSETVNTILGSLTLSNSGSSTNCQSTENLLPESTEPKQWMTADASWKAWVQSGDGEEISKAESKTAIEISKKQEFENGLEAFQKGDYESALSIWLPLAESGHPIAQHNVGVMHQNGFGVPKDDGEAVKWWRQAAELGYPPSEVNMGSAYLMGKGVEQNFMVGRSWLDRATEHGSIDALVVLGEMYERGEDVVKDNKRALELYLQAGRRGSAMGFNNAAWLEATSDDPAVRNSTEALNHALEAVRITKEQDAGILDTLAEAYFANGLLANAIETEKKAIALQPDEQDFLNRLQKFTQAKDKQR